MSGVSGVVVLQNASKILAFKEVGNEIRHGRNADVCQIADVLLSNLMIHDIFSRYTHAFDH